MFSAPNSTYAEEAKFQSSSGSAYMLVPAIAGGAAAVLLVAGSLLSWMYLSRKKRRSKSVLPISSDLAIDDEISDFPHPAHLRFPPEAATVTDEETSTTQLPSPTVADMGVHDEASSDLALDVINTPHRGHAGQTQIVCVCVCVLLVTGVAVCAMRMQPTDFCTIPFHLPFYLLVLAVHLHVLPVDVWHSLD